MPGADRWADALTRDQVHDLVRHRDLRSALAIGWNWRWLAAALALVARRPNALTVPFALLWSPPTASIATSSTTC